MVAIGGAIPVPPSSLSRSHSQSEAQGGATVQEPKRTRTVRRNRRHPAFGAARVVVWQHPAGARLKIHLISWGSCAKPRTVWLRPIFGGTGCRCTLLLLWYLARPRSAPSAHSLMQESTAPRRNRCWVHHCSRAAPLPYSLPLATCRQGFRDSGLVALLGHQHIRFLQINFPGSLDSSVRSVEVTSNQTQLMPSHYHLIISSHLVPAHIGSSHCPNTD